jgi:sugar phosphate isomerase/epimerase
LNERVKAIKDMITFISETGGKEFIVESGGDPEKPEQWEVLIDVLRTLLDHAEAQGVILAFENSPHVLIDDEDDLLRLMKEFDSKSLGINFDPANINMCPPGNWNVPNSIRKVADYIVSVHVKDSIYGGGKYGKTPEGKWNCPPLGEGTTPWRECVQVFKEIKYNGFWTIEYFAPNLNVKEAEKGVVHNKTYIKNYLTEYY